MKVLHINIYDMGGGAETVFRITRHNPSTVNFVGCVKTKSSATLPDISFRSWEFENKLLGTLNYIFSLNNYAALQDFLDKNEVDVIHLHGFFTSLSPSILLAIRRVKVKKEIRIIQTLHDFHLACPNSSLYNFNKNKICEKCIGKKTKLPIFVQNCDRRGFFYSTLKGIRSFIANNILKHRELIDIFICPSEFLKLKLISDGIQEYKVIVIRNPVDIKGSSQHYEKNNLICFFGRFSKEKNLEFLIKAFTSWKDRTKNDFKLLLIGDGEEKVSIEKFAAKSQNASCIILKDYMQPEQLVEEIKHAKYFSMATMCYENAPMSIIESLKLEIIPIAPNIGGMKESIELISTVGKTYEPNNIESWISAVDELEINYESILLKLRENKSTLLREFAIDNYYRKVLETYKDYTLLP